MDLLTDSSVRTKFQPVHPLQLSSNKISQGESSGPPTSTSPIKRRASQAEELLKAEEAGGTN